MSRHKLFIIAILGIGCEPSPGTSSRSQSNADTANRKPEVTAAVLTGSFAYVDSTGTELLALDSLPDPSAVLGALCSGGGVVSVRFDRRQAGQASDNGRAIASNFSNQKGDVFRALQRKAPPDKTCFLSTDSALLSHSLTVTAQPPTVCAPDRSARIASVRKRPVMHCWQIARMPAGGEVHAVQFATVDSSALASLVVVRDSSLLFRDFPAISRGSDESVWRVDDQGIFSPEDFDILFVSALPGAFVMATTWGGAEGESDELLLADSAQTFRARAQGYRYWAPL